MRCYFAPMEGITGSIFRNCHSRYFPGVDRYYMPFLSPRQDHNFTRRELDDILPEHNEGVHAVPQLLTRQPEDFLWAAGELAAMGYREVNLNLGCPSGTVTAKGKGSGLLARREELEQLLDGIFAAAPMAISIKTRLGMHDPEEFGPLLELYNRYPVAELTVHPRIRGDFYKKPVRPEYFDLAVRMSRAPLCYNGDIITPGDWEKASRRWPSVEAVMIGRGLVADPSLAGRLKGEQPAGLDTLRAFHHELYETYAQAFGSRRNAMLRMKEIWVYLIHLFGDSEKLERRIRRASDTVDFESAVAEVFRTLPLLDAPAGEW